MRKPRTKDVKRLITELVFPFYEIGRDMDIPLNKRRKENDAEHTWAVSLLACALAERIDPTLDLGKVAQLAIVHDMVEIFAGDTSIWDDQLLADKQQREENALKILINEYDNFPWIGKAAREYEAKASKEALYIWAVDKYVASFMRILDLEKGGRFFIDEQPKTLGQFQQGIEATRRKAHAHDQVGQYYDELLAIVAKHPEWFAKG